MKISLNKFFCSHATKCAVYEVQLERLTGLHSRGDVIVFRKEVQGSEICMTNIFEEDFVG